MAGTLSSYCRAILSFPKVKISISLIFIVMTELKFPGSSFLWYSLYNVFYKTNKIKVRNKCIKILFYMCMQNFRNVAAVIKIFFQSVNYSYNSFLWVFTLSNKLKNDASENDDGPGHILPSDWLLYLIDFFYFV